MKYVMLNGLASTLIAGCAAVAQQSEDPLAGFERTGEMRSCLSLTAIDHMNAVDENHFLVETRSGEFYVNELERRCNRAGSQFTYLQHDTTVNSLCSNDLVRIVDRNTNAIIGACTLNEFERLEPAGD